jgi:hypothetical protein
VSVCGCLIARWIAAVGELVDDFDRVVEANYAAFGDVRAETASVNERAKESGSREFLEVGARFG